METKDIFSLVKIHGLKIFAAVTLLLIALFFFMRFQQTKREENGRDFFKVRTLLEQFYAHKPLSQEAHAELKAIFTRHPELGFHYGHALTLSLLTQHNGCPNFEQQITQLEAHSLPFYSNFLKISTIIHTNKEEALALSQQLEEDLQSSPLFERLRLMNLVRMVFLAEELQKPDAPRYYQMAKQLPSYADYAAIFEARGLGLEEFIKKSS